MFFFLTYGKIKIFLFYVVVIIRSGTLRPCLDVAY